MSARRVDAVVIGSGASGAVMAFELARRGMKVAVLERGAREDPHTFEHDELAQFGRVYKQGGLQLADDKDTVFIQGATVGGSTVINNAIWMRCDARPDPARLGGRGRADRPRRARARLGRARDGPARAAGARRPPRTGARSSSSDGCESAGIPGEFLDNNRLGCIACGWCNYGCRYDRKTSMLVTYIPWAEGRGAEVIDRCDDVRVVTRDGRATGVEGTRDGTKVALDADRVDRLLRRDRLERLLLRSGITAGGRVGSACTC